jgi:hypothetical protein
VEGEVFGNDWKEIKKGVYVSGDRKLMKVWFCYWFL